MYRPLPPLFLSMLFRAASVAWAPRSAFSFVARRPRAAAVPSALFSAAPAKIPVTLLSGFLGSGKTTALKHLLENGSGARIGVVVNDVAEVNVDAKLISSSLEAAGGDAALLELRNGCVCCSLADDLLDAVRDLTTGRDLEHVVVETSGVADPGAVRDAWAGAAAREHPAEIRRVVTVVDAAAFGTDWMTLDAAGDREGWAEGGEDAARRIPELLADQIEGADAVLMNKADVAGEARTREAADLVRAMNGRAALHAAEFGKVDASVILGTGEPSETLEPSEQSSETSETSCCSDPTCASPDCGDAAAPSRPATPADLGIASFVYREARPFETRRLLRVLNAWPVPTAGRLDLSQIAAAAAEEPRGDADGAEASPFRGVLRSKGFCWMAPAVWCGPGGDAWRHDVAMYWSHAGTQFAVDAAGQWWATRTKDDVRAVLAGDPERCARILREDWVTEEFGDRRQELVFIGVGMDEDGIRRTLDDCLLSKEEMDNYRQELKRAANGDEARPFDDGRIAAET